MKIVRMIRQMQRLSDRFRKAGRVIGLVPTMGALHEGHLSLIRTARKRADIVVVSIFVNPTQFGPTEDFHQYPRDPQADQEKCRKAGVDILFMPPVSQMYAKDHATFVTTERLTQVLCGPFRPGHFRGVTTVLSQLFNIIRPHLAFFGQKDYQQAMVLQQMVKDLHFDIKIVNVPTVRERDGLAMSSRNAYLSTQERLAARMLYQALMIGKVMILEGESDPSKIKTRMEDLIKKEFINLWGPVRKKRETSSNAPTPRTWAGQARPSPYARIEYISICHPKTLQEVQKIESKVLLALAVWIGKTRLIDNILVK